MARLVQELDNKVIILVSDLEWIREEAVVARINVLSPKSVMYHLESYHKIKADYWRSVFISNTSDKQYR